MLNRDISALFFYYMGQSKLFLQIFAARRHIYLADIICRKEVIDMAKRDSFYILIADVIVLCNRTVLFINCNRWEEFTFYF